MTRVLMVAAPRSGSGKTTLTLALLSAFRNRGLRVAAAKCGPDYIDPGFHEAATGRPCFNLDSWTMDDATLATQFRMAAQDCDLLIVESAMGLFDGLSKPEGARGAASDLAARFDIPVLLTLDVAGQGQSAAALAQGVATWQPGVNVVGVVLNRVASERHERMCAEFMRLPVIGAMRRDPALALPERHLGLVQARERGDLSGLFATLADRAERDLLLNAISELARPVAVNGPVTTEAPLPPPGQSVAVACDEAFSFLYPHLLEGWRQAGADIRFFSPLENEAVPETCHACWLPGGYPELHAGRLAGASLFRESLAAFAEERPVHGECGGYMVLGRTLEDADGVVYPMTGLLSHETSFARRAMNLGYREARTLHDGVFGAAGTILRGHEFHYARVTEPGDDAPFATIADGYGADLGLAGGMRGQVSGTFFHVLAARRQ